jgi:hypothetical protein
MLMPVYLILAAVIYGVLADRTDRAIEREMRKRQPHSSDLRLVEEFSVRPDLGLRHGRPVGQASHRRSRTPSADRLTERSSS